MVIAYDFLVNIFKKIKMTRQNLFMRILITYTLLLIHVNMNIHKGNTKSTLSFKDYDP